MPTFRFLILVLAVGAVYLGCSKDMPSRNTHTEFGTRGSSIGPNPPPGGPDKPDPGPSEPPKPPPDKDDASN